MLSVVSPDTQRAPFPAGSVERWQPAPFAIDPWMVLRLCRYRRPDAVEPAIREVAAHMAARAGELIAPAALLRVARVETGPGEVVRLDGSPTFSGRAVATLLAGCPSAAVFALTLGPALEREVAARAEGRELLEAFLLDTAGWAAIETSVRALRLDLRARARRRHWRVTHRLAPGYRDWPLGEQAALLAALGDTVDLVRLTEHGVLVPFKSLTGLFGLGPDAA